MTLNLLLALFGGILLGVALGHMLRNKDDEHIKRAQSKTIHSQLDTIHNQRMTIRCQGLLLEVLEDRLQKRGELINRFHAQLIKGEGISLDDPILEKKGGEENS